MTDAEVIAALLRDSRRRARRLALVAWLGVLASVLIAVGSRGGYIDGWRCHDGATHAVHDLTTGSWYCISEDAPPAPDPEEDTTDA